jgi:hypothetical protein
MIKGGTSLKKHKRPYDRVSAENYDMDGILFSQECEIYALVDFLLRENNRIRRLALEARCQANALARRHLGKPYPDIGADAYNACFDDHPAMLRYHELFDGSEAGGRY